MFSNFLPQGTPTTGKAVLLQKAKADQTPFADYATTAPAVEPQMIPQFSTLLSTSEEIEPQPFQLESPSFTSANSDYEKRVNEEANRLIEKENIDMSSPENRELVNARAVFNVKAQNGNIDLDLLEKFLPHRTRNISPAEHARLDPEVIELAKKLDIQMNSASIKALAGSEDAKRLETQTGEADFSTKIAIASSIVDMTRNRPDLRNLVLEGEGNKPLRITVSTNPDSSTGGYASNDNQMFIHVAHLWEASVHNGFNVVTHEFTHLLDEGFSVKDGLLPYLSDNDQKLFEGEMKRLFNLKLNEPTEPNLPNYAFSANGEFLSMAMEAFMETPQQLKTISPIIFNLFSEYFNYDPSFRYAPPQA